MGSRVLSIVGCFPELCFLRFSVARVLVGLRKQLINNFVFSTWEYAAGFNNNKKNIYVCICKVDSFTVSITDNCIQPCLNI